MSKCLRKLWKSISVRSPYCVSQLLQLVNDSYRKVITLWKTTESSSLASREKKRKIINFAPPIGEKKNEKKIERMCIGKIQLCLVFHDRESMFNLFSISYSNCARCYEVINVFSKNTSRVGRANLWIL